MTCGIYKITNTLNGKSYIGASGNIERRFMVHRSKGEGRINKIIHKYGLENFTFTILEECLKEDLREREKYYVALYDSYYNGYNLSKGGETNYNTTGYVNVAKSKTNDNELGYTFVYNYSKNGKRYGITCADLKILEKKVKNQRLPWKILDKTIAENTLKNNQNDLLDTNYTPNIGNTTGFYNVSKVKGSNYRYHYNDDNVKKVIASVDILLLKKKVKELGMPWKIINDEAALKTIKESEEYNYYSPNQRRSISVNTTGFYRVTMDKDETCNQGFTYTYQYYDGEKRRKISSVDILKLEQKVKSKGLPWKIIDEENAFANIDYCSKNSYNDSDNKTGFYNVYIVKNEKYIKGYYYEYGITKKGRTIRISSVDLMKLKQKVESKGLIWKIIDEEKAKIILEKEGIKNDEI